MKLSINDPNRAKQRQSIEPLTEHDLKAIVSDLNQGVIRNEDIQRLIDEYENLKHFYTVVGGWEGYERLLGVSNITTTADIKVEYELVKPHSKPKKTFHDKMNEKMNIAKQEYEQRKNKGNG